MSKTVRVNGLTSENATLLLEAAQNLDLDASAVRTSSRGHFVVDEEIAKKAGVDYESDDEEPTTTSHLVADDGGSPADSDESEQPKAAKKTAAKKTAAKKTASANAKKE